MQFVQDGADEVLLDETLIFRFTEDLERSSITSRSVRIHPASRPAEAAEGRLRIHRDRLEFEPMLPRLPDLSDGGLLPGTLYRVVLEGFPRPDGVRSVGGEVLARTLEFEFRTAPRAGRLFGGEPGAGYLGIEVSRGSGAAGIELRPLDPLTLTASCAVDPRSLARGEFCMLPREGDPKEDVIPLEPRLVQNRPGGARIELYPAGAALGMGDLRALELGEYFLLRTRDDMRDLNGGRLPFGRRAAGLGSGGVRVDRPLLTVSVVAPHNERTRLQFGHGEGPWYGEPVGFDGTAAWTSDGVTVRYPAAAGDGADGRQDPFEGLDGRTDVAATSLRIPTGHEVRLDHTHGFVVLRSQGVLEVAGTLSRELEGDWPDSLARALARTPLGPESSRESLTHWLDRARRLNEPWTVLVAGGDLRVTGAIQVDGPLLLIAGGWLRVYGRVEATSVFKSEGGGENIGRVQTAPLRLDPPSSNVLVHPLRVAVLTNTFRPRRGVASWLEATPHGSAGGGGYRVRFLGLRDRQAGSDRFEPVDDIQLLDGCQALRLLLVLEVPAGRGEPWDPPRLESVDLGWSVPE